MHGLLDQAIQYRWNSQLPSPAICLGYFYPSYRFWLVATAQKQFLYTLPVFLQKWQQLVNTHAVNTC